MCTRPSFRASLATLLTLLAVPVTAPAQDLPQAPSPDPWEPVYTVGGVGHEAATHLPQMPEESGAAAGIEPRGPSSNGGLPPSAKDVELRGRLRLTLTQERVTDVFAFGNYAYVGTMNRGIPVPSPNSRTDMVTDVARYACERLGVHVVDISDPARPREVAVIDTNYGAVQEGIQVVHLDTPKFEGDVLAFGQSVCHGVTPGFKDPGPGGVSLYDVSDPTDPKPLALDAGDHTAFGQTWDLAMEAHNVFVWQQGERAFAALSDENEAGKKDLDILEITDPREPVLISETGLPDLPQARVQGGEYPLLFAHDVTVRKIDGTWTMLVSWWDAGFVKLDIDDPAKPVYLADSQFPDPDPITGHEPSGDAHQAVFDPTARFILGGAESFDSIHEHARPVPEQAPWPEELGVPREVLPSEWHFKGWGALHLLDAHSLEEIDSYAIAEARDPAKAMGYGYLTVHDVKVDSDAALAYASWYAGGLRVLRYGPDGLSEVGHYVGEGGADYWGVFPHVLPNGERVVLASDMDYGLYLLRYTGPR